MSTKIKKEKTFCQEEREERQEIVDRKRRKADLLAAEQNKKVKGEFEIFDPIDAQMEATVQETRQNVIKAHWNIIPEANNIVDMKMYIKRFVANEFSYLLDNDNTSDTTVEVDGDDDNGETELTDCLLINYFFFPSPPSHIYCACAGCLLTKDCAPFVGVCYFCDASFVSPSLCDLKYNHDPLQCSKQCGEVLCPNCITTEVFVPCNCQCTVCIQHTCHLCVDTEMY
jgi:hypothetical protein